MTFTEATALAADPAVTDDEFARRLCPHMPLDPGIRRAVRVLAAAGIEVFESCEGGARHAFAEPTVRFHGGRHEGWRAVAAAQEVGLRILHLNRVWTIDDGEPTGPYWDLVLR